MIPALASGDYRVKVRAAVHGGTEVRTGALAATLTVS